MDEALVFGHWPGKEAENLPFSAPQSQPRKGCKNRDGNERRDRLRDLTYRPRWGYSAADPSPGEGAVPPQRSTDHFELKPAQQRVLGVLKSEGTARLTRARYEELSGVSRSQAAYDLAELVENGILERLGSGRATRYRLVHVNIPGGGSRRRWTQERIRAALTEFCAGQDTWPSAAEFKRAGRFDLYVAASRYGGIRFWTSELGLTRELRPAPPAVKPWRRTFRPRLQWVPAAAVAALALALAGGGQIRLSPGGAVLRAAPPQELDAILKAPTTRIHVGRVKATRPTKRVARRVRATPAQHGSTTAGSTELASVQATPSTQSSSPARATYSSSTPTSSSTPSPLPAPSGGTARRPLPPPPPGS